MPSPDLPIIQAVQKYAGNLNKHFIGGKFVSGVGRDNIVSVNPSNGAPLPKFRREASRISIQPYKMRMSASRMYGRKLRPMSARKPFAKSPLYLKKKWILPLR